MKMNIGELQGMQPAIESALKVEGIHDSDQLLIATGQPKARTELAAKLGIPERTLLELANRADLARIRGVGRVYADLLEYAGVDTVAELRTRNADNLHAKIVEMAEEHHVQRVPRPDQVQDWVAQAKELDRAIFY
jgi:predicted flap endonuclease-1-like 5' DNA nuclease